MSKFSSTFMGKIIFIIFFSAVISWFLRSLFASLYVYLYQPTNYSGIFLLPNLDNFAGFLLSYPFLASLLSFSIERISKKSILLLVVSLLPFIMFSLISSFWISFFWYIAMSIAGYILAWPIRKLILKK